MLGYLPSEWRFIIRLVFKTDRVSQHGLFFNQAHQGHHGAGIQSSAKKGAKRHIADQPDLCRFIQQVLQSFFGFMFIIMTVPRKLNLPVSLMTDFAILPNQECAGFQLINVLKHGNRTRDVAQRKISIHGFQIKISRNGTVRQDCF